MSTEADIVEKARRSLDQFWSHTRTDVIVGMMAEITKLRAERDAKARDMRERCASEAFFTLASVVISDTGGTELGDHVASAIRALPDTPAFVATDGKDAT